MYRFLVSPRWILSHVLIGALTVTMINLGFWQLRRLDDRRELNAKVTERIEATADPFDVVTSDVDNVADGESVDYRAVVVEGEYLVNDEILVPGRDNGGGPGQWVATPLRTGSGEVVLILRGSIPAALGDETPPVEQAAPPSGTVRIAGWVRRSERQSGLTPDEALIDGRRFNRLELPRIAEVLGQPLAPVMVQLANQDPPGSSPLIEPIPLPELTEGSHLSYAGQWFIFSAIAVFGYPVILRRAVRAKKRERERDTAGSPPPSPGGGEPAAEDDSHADDSDADLLGAGARVERGQR